MMNWRVIYSRSGVSNEVISFPGSVKFLAFFARVFAAWILFSNILNTYDTYEYKSKSWLATTPEQSRPCGLCYGRCCCEAEVLTGDMRPRETMGNMGMEWGGETVFMTPDPVQCTVSCPVTTLHST